MSPAVSIARAASSSDTSSTSPAASKAPGQVAQEPAVGEAYFDLMVEDLEVTHQQLCSKGLSPSAIAEGRIHSSFPLASPSGHTLKFNSTHVSDQPV